MIHCNIAFKINEKVELYYRAVSLLVLLILINNNQHGMKSTRLMAALWYHIAEHNINMLSNITIVIVLIATLISEV